MSDNVPFEIQEEILTNLPVKSLLRFRSVSKSWKSLIHSSRFVAGYSSGHHTQPPRLLVRSQVYRSYNISRRLQVTKTKYVSIVDDDDTFSKHKVYLPKPPLVEILESFCIIGNSHGLLCLYGYHSCHIGGPGKDMAVVWNISIRKAVAVVVPNVANKKVCRTDLGFGVCRETMDPKIVKITYICNWGRRESVTCIPKQVEVFTLSTGAWRSPYSSNLPRKAIHFGSYKVVLEGCLYWLAADRIDGSRYCNMIILFDMTSEEFTEVHLPECLNLVQHNLSMFKLRESLVVLQSGEEADNEAFSVWMMEDGVPKSFTKLFTFDVNKPDASSSIEIHGFRKSGEPIIEITKKHEYERGQLVVYEPYTKHVDKLAGMNGKETSFSVYPYLETLLLLDKPDHAVYHERGISVIDKIASLFGRKRLE